MTTLIIVFWAIVGTVVIGTIMLRTLWKLWPGNTYLWNRVGCNCTWQRQIVDGWNYRGTERTAKFVKCPKVNSKGGHQLCGPMLWLYTLAWPVALPILLVGAAIGALGWGVVVGIGKGTKVITNNMQKAITS